MIIAILASFKRKPYVSQTPSIKGYVNVFNKSTKATVQLQPQRMKGLDKLQAEFDMCTALQQERHVRIIERSNNRANLDMLFA